MWNFIRNFLQPPPLGIPKYECTLHPCASYHTSRTPSGQRHLFTEALLSLPQKVTLTHLFNDPPLHYCLPSFQGWKSEWLTDNPLFGALLWIGFSLEIHNIFGRVAIYSDSSHTWPHSPLILSALPNQCHPVLTTCSHAAYFFRLPRPVSSSQPDLVLLTCLTKNVFKIFHCEDWCKESTDLCYSGFSISEYPFYMLAIKWSYEFLYCIPAFELLRELCKACFNSSVALLFFCLHLFYGCSVPSFE